MLAVQLTTGGGETTVVVESSGNVESERLSYDNLNIAKRALANNSVIVSTKQDGKSAEDEVTAAFAADFTEINKEAIDDSSGIITAVTLANSKSSIDNNSIVGRVIEIGKSADEKSEIELQDLTLARKSINKTTIITGISNEAKRSNDRITAAIFPVSQFGKSADDNIVMELGFRQSGKRSFDDISNEVTARITDKNRKSAGNVTAIILSTPDVGKKATTSDNINVDFFAFSDAVSSSTGAWEDPQNAVGDTPFFASITASPTGIGGTQQVTETGILTMDFTDPKFEDLSLSTDVLIELFRGINAAPTEIGANRSYVITYEYSVNGNNFIEFQRDEGAVTVDENGGTVSSTISGLSVQEVATLKMRSVASVRSGIGIAGDTRLFIVRFNISFEAAKEY